MYVFPRRNNRSKVGQFISAKLVVLTLRLLDITMKSILPIRRQNRELLFLQELRKIGFCHNKNVLSSNEKRMDSKVPPVWPMNSHKNIDSAKVKFSRNPKTILWILCNSKKIWST